MMNEKAMMASPKNGDFMYSADGYIKDGVLSVPVTVKGPLESGLCINGMEVVVNEGVLQATVALNGFENKVVLTNKAGHVLDEMTLYNAMKTEKTYRFSLDDNIWWLKDLADNAGKYRSIFDNPFLGFFKRLHTAFGTKVHFNLYYRDLDSDFNLSMMPDIYKEEFVANADWIALTFHAYANDPDKPYENTTYERIYKDCELITNEIKRFAGEELLSRYTTVHWGAVNREGCKALRDFGFNGFLGYFIMSDGKPSVSYYFNEEQTQHLNGRDMWRDMEMGLTFVKIDMVVNLFDEKDVVPYLKKVVDDAHVSGFIELMIHEQYYYPKYFAYQPDYETKVWEAVRFVTEKGYKPVFLKDVLP